jgi:beta-phosphoglucomutase-like phosphatase (HAD superfamily)
MKSVVIVDFDGALLNSVHLHTAAWISFLSDRLQQVSRFSITLANWAC